MILGHPVDCRYFSFHNLQQKTVLEGIFFVSFNFLETVHLMKYLYHENHFLALPLQNYTEQETQISKIEMNF